MSEAPLPEIVRRYLARALPDAGAEVRTLRVHQAGEMWLAPGARARRFGAVQDYAVDDVAFSWRATFPLVPLVSLRVTDRFASGDGRLSVRLFGFPIVRQTGPETSIGEAARYLAELPWVPYAMRRNRRLDWRQLNEATVEVSTSVAGRSVAVTLVFDADGDIGGARSESRPYPVGKTFTPMPWSGTFSDYRDFGSVRLPSHGEVRWELPDGPYTYWSGRITAVDLDPPR